MKSKSTVKIFDKIYEFELQDPPRVQSFSPKFVHTVTMCIHISSECNLNCKYCFRQNVPQLKFSDAARFIEPVTTLYPHADRYIVDLLGAGECKIVSYYRYGRIDGLDANMCKIKKYLYAAAMYFIDKLKNGNSNIYNWLISETKKINSYYDADDKLIETVEASQGK